MRVSEIYCTCNCQFGVVFFYFQRCSMNGQLKNRKLASFCSYLYLGLSERSLSCNINLCLTGWCWQLAIQISEHVPAHTTTKFLARHKFIAIMSQKRKLKNGDLLWTSDKGAVLTGEHPLSVAIWVVSSHAGQVSSVESAQFTVKQAAVMWRGFLSVRFGCITSLCHGVEVVQLPLHIWGLQVKRFCQEDTTNHSLCRDTTNAKSWTQNTS